MASSLSPVKFIVFFRNKSLVENSSQIIIKNPDCIYNRGFKKVASTYSPTLKRAVPSAQAGLTSLFGMGRGGPCCYRHPKR